MIAIDMAHWPKPFGWLYLNVLGNVVAGIFCAVAFWKAILERQFDRIHTHFERIHAHNAAIRRHLRIKDE